jgi:competence protein ComEA
MKKHMLNKSFSIAAMLVLLLVLTGPALATDAAKVNINKATAMELQELKGIGEKYAANIVDYRTQNGPFKKIEDIMMVPGIGEAVWEANKDLITVE